MCRSRIKLVILMSILIALKSCLSAEESIDSAADDRYLIYRHDIAFAWIPPNPNAKSRHLDSDHPIVVEDGDGFYSGVYEITQADWRRITGQSFQEFIKNKKESLGYDIPLFFGDKLPAYCLSYSDAVGFIDKLNEMESGHRERVKLRYAIPSEAEWVYAARAGCKNDFITGKYLLPGEAVFAAEISDVSSRENKIEWQQLERLHPLAKGPMDVGTCSKKNEYGLYDIHGNVSELTKDLHRNIESRYPELAGKEVYITKGGAWCSTMRGCAFNVTGWCGVDYNFAREYVGLRVIARIVK